MNFLVNVAKDFTDNMYINMGLYSHLFDVMHFQIISKNKFVFKEGQPVKYIFMISDGIFESQKLLRSNKIQMNTRLQQIQNSYFGLDEFLLGEKVRKHSMMCMSEKAFYYQVSTKDFQIYFTPFLISNLNLKAIKNEEITEKKLNLYKNKIPFIKPQQSDIHKLNKLEKESVGYIIELNYLQQKSSVKSVPDFLKFRDQSQKIRTRLTLMNDQKPQQGQKSNEIKVYPQTNRSCVKSLNMYQNQLFTTKLNEKKIQKKPISYLTKKYIEQEAQIVHDVYQRKYLEYQRQLETENFNFTPNHKIIKLEQISDKEYSRLSSKNQKLNFYNQYVFMEKNFQQVNYLNQIHVDREQQNIKAMQVIDFSKQT